MMTWVVLTVLWGVPDARVPRIDSPLQARVDAGGEIELPAGVFGGRERVGTGCAPRVWGDGKGAAGRPSARFERWVVPPSSCVFAYVSPVIDVTYAGMEWPDRAPAANVRRGE